VAYGLKIIPSIESVRYAVNTGQSSFSNTLIQTNPVVVQNGDAHLSYVLKFMLNQSTCWWNNPAGCAVPQFLS
jgi:hypothetical protein